MIITQQVSSPPITSTNNLSSSRLAYRVSVNTLNTQGDSNVAPHCLLLTKWRCWIISPSDWSEAVKGYQLESGQLSSQVSVRPPSEGSCARTQVAGMPCATLLAPSNQRNPTYRICLVFACLFSRARLCSVITKCWLWSGQILQC